MAKDEKYEYGVENAKDTEKMKDAGNIFSKDERKCGDVAAKFYSSIK